MTCSESKLEKVGDTIITEVIGFRPETKWSNYYQIEVPISGMNDRTRVCCKILGWIVVRGERLIKFGDIWFSAKSILVERFKF